MRLDIVAVFLFLFLIVLPIFGLYLHFMNLIFKHEMTKDAIRIQFMGFIPIRKVALKDIESIEVVNLQELPDPTVLFYAEKWPGKASEKEGILIKKRTGISRVLIMTPKKPREFVQAVNKLRGDKAAVKMT